MWDNLHLISDSKHPPLEKYFAYSQIPSAQIGRVFVNRNLDLERTEDVKQYMLEKLRIPYLTNVWKSKKHNSYDCQLSIGGGRSGVNFKVSARNKYGLASIYLHFEECQELLYHSFERRITELRTRIHPLLIAQNRKVGISFNPEGNLDNTKKKLAQLLERMLKTIGAELYVDVRR